MNIRTRSHLVLLLALFALPLAGMAQELGGRGGFRDRVLWHFGANLTIVPVKDVFKQEVFAAQPLFTGVQGGGSYTILHGQNDFMSLNAEANAVLSLGFIGGAGQGTRLLLQAPLFLTARIGAKATRFNENRLGAGVGIGGAFSYVSLPFFTFNGQTGSLRETLVHPMAMGELTLRTDGGGVYALRVHYALGGRTSSESTGEPLTYEMWAIALLITSL